MIENRLFELLEKMDKSLSNTHNEKWLNIREVKNYTSLSIGKIRNALASGELKGSKIAGRWLIKIRWIEKWLKS